MSDIFRLYEESYPPSVYAQQPPSTGATAGIPGTWTPAGSLAPASVAALQAGTPNVVTATPATAWTTGQYVQTRTAGAAGQANWSGSAWVLGPHALAATAEASGSGSSSAPAKRQRKSAP